MSETLSYTLRMPEDLKRFIEAEAAKRKISSAAFVIAACWSELEEPDDYPFDRPTLSSSGEKYRITGTSLKAVVNDVPANIAALRAIPGVFRASDIGTPKQDEAKSSMPHVAAVIPPTAVVEQCHITSQYYDQEGYSDGEMYRCALRAGHKGNHAKGQKV